MSTSGRCTRLHPRPSRPSARPAPRSTDGGRLPMTTTSTDAAVVTPASRLRGEIVLPGDKSIRHRAVMFATLAGGTSRISGAGDGADVRSTAAICRALGAQVDRLEAGPAGDPSAVATVDYRVVSPGVDGLHEPAADLDCGNS